MNSFEISSRHLWRYIVWVHFVQLLQNAYGWMLFKEKMFLLDSSSCPTWSQNLHKVPLASSLGTATSREVHQIYSTRHIMGSQYCKPLYEKNVNTLVGMAFGVLTLPNSFSPLKNPPTWTSVCNKMKFGVQTTSSV